MNWKEAEEYLKECEAAYASIGRAGMLALTITIAPLRDRYNEGERTQELYDEIFAVSL